MPLVTLTPDEIAVATLIGETRRLRSERMGIHDAYGASFQDKMAVDVEGALYESAVAQWMGLDFGRVGTIDNFHGPDLPGLQVRGTSHPHGSLIVRDGDKDDDPFILVIGRNGRYRLVGWAYGYEAKQERYRRSTRGRPQPAYFMPQDALQSLPERYTKKEDR